MYVNVSVVIPTYNRGYCIKDAIESVLAQSFQSFELIVIDDGSTDDTVNIVKPYENHIRFIRQTNGGASVARNSGIMAANGKWVSFLDSDDLWSPNKLAIQVEDLEKYPDAVGHMVDAVLREPIGRHSTLFELRGVRSEFQMNPLRTRPLKDVLKTQFFTSCWMLRRDAILKAGCFDPGLRIYEDIDLLARVAIEGAFIVNCYPGTSMHRRPGDSEALSGLSQTARLMSLQNLVHTYSRLTTESRLTPAERQLACRCLSGVRWETAVQYWKQGQRNDAVATLLRSVADDPGLRTITRTLLTITGLIAPVNRMLNRLR